MYFVGLTATPTHHHGRSCLRLRVYVCCSTGESRPLECRRFLTCSARTLNTSGRHPALLLIHTHLLHPHSASMEAKSSAAINTSAEFPQLLFHLQHFFLLLVFYFSSFFLFFSPIVPPVFLHCAKNEQRSALKAFSSSSHFLPLSPFLPCSLSECIYCSVQSVGGCVYVVICSLLLLPSFSVSVRTDSHTQIHTFFDPWPVRSF